MTNNELKRRAKTAYAIYKLRDAVTLDDVYGSYSVYKARAYRDCIDTMVMLDGYDFRIISHNVNIFTCGFRYKMNEIEMFMYITPNYRVSIALTTAD